MNNCSLIKKKWVYWGQSPFRTRAIPTSPWCMLYTEKREVASLFVSKTVHLYYLITVEYGKFGYKMEATL